MEKTHFKNNYTIAQIEITNNYLNGVYQLILEQLAHDLEQNYKLNWKTQSYDVFLGNYVLHMIHVLYDRWIGVRNTIQCQKKAIRINIPADFLEHSEWSVGNDNYNLLFESPAVPRSFPKAIIIVNLEYFRRFNCELDEPI